MTKVCHVLENSCRGIKGLVRFSSHPACVSTSALTAYSNPNSMKFAGFLISSGTSVSSPLTACDGVADTGCCSKQLKSGITKRINPGRKSSSQDCTFSRFRPMRSSFANFSNRKSTAFYEHGAVWQDLPPLF